MTRLKILIGFMLTMFGGALLWVTFLAPYIDAVVPTEIKEADLGMFFLGMATFYFGSTIMGASLQELDMIQKARFKQRKFLLDKQ
jgi:predicted MFS family arabinose efflux permease